MKNRNGRTKTLETAMLDGISMGDAGKVKRLLMARADPNVRAGDMGLTPLHRACNSHNIDIVRLLLDHGADVNARDKNYVTSLSYACYDDYTAPDILRLLIEKGADVNARDKWGNSALHNTCRMSACNSAAAFLINNGADVNLRNKIDQTPLDLACQTFNTRAVELLLKAGADVSTENRPGYNPLNRANSLSSDHPLRERLFDLFRQYAPELALEGVLSLPFEDPLRERTLEWYREHHPEMVMETYCTAGPGG